MDERNERSPPALSGDALLQVLEGAPDAILLADANGCLRFANRQAERMFGYERDELIGQTIEILVPNAFRASHGALRQRYMQAPASRPMGLLSALSAQRRDGTTFMVEVSLSPIRTDEGSFVAAAVRDVSERKRQEAAERLANQRLRSAVESIQTMFALFDAEDRLVLCNSAFRQLFGDVDGTMSGRRFCELVEAERNVFADTSVARWLAYHAEPDGSLDLTVSDGRSLRIAERPTPEGGRVTTVLDVSEDVARELEVEQARALAEAASAAKSAFLASMSHELRTPLNAILGFTQLMARDRRDPPSERQQQRLHQVLQAGEHLLRLIEDVLDLSRIESGRLSVSLEEVAVASVLDEVAAALDPAAMAAGITVLPVSASASLAVSADRTRLVQVLMNFGSNAIKYGRRGGSVCFEASAIPGGRVSLSVTDDGQGIAEEHQPRLFEPFHRAGQDRGPIEGTGIGLALCKRLASLMGGTVGFNSRVGAGSSFWIELPAAPARRSLATSDASSVRRRSGPPRTVLYVEDNPSNLAVMRALVQELEWIELLTATSAEEGIELARAEAPSLVLMDINLPGISGWEAGRKLKSIPATCAIPIVALSAAKFSNRDSDAPESPFARYLTKPVELDVLSETLEDLIAQAE
ncbi:MAG TPA: PAS domain S-box protein [Polyangiales bacterium]